MHIQHTLMMAYWWIQNEIEERLTKLEFDLDKANSPLLASDSRIYTEDQVPTNSGGLEWCISIPEVPSKEDPATFSFSFVFTDCANEAVMSLILPCESMEDEEAINVEQAGWKFEFTTSFNAAEPDMPKYMQKAYDFVVGLGLFSALPPIDQPIDKLTVDLTDDKADELIKVLCQLAADDR